MATINPFSNYLCTPIRVVPYGAGWPARNSYADGVLAPFAHCYDPLPLNGWGNTAYSIWVTLLSFANGSDEFMVVCVKVAQLGQKMTIQDPAGSAHHVSPEWSWFLMIERLKTGRGLRKTRMVISGGRRYERTWPWYPCRLGGWTVSRFTVSKPVRASQANSFAVRVHFSWFWFCLLIIFFHGLLRICFTLSGMSQ